MPARSFEFVRSSLWWAGLLALPVLGVLALTVRRWTAPVHELGHVGLKSRMPRLFWPVVGVITILYAATAAPRLRQSLWDDEVYTVRKIVLGTDRIQSDGSAKIKQLPWSHTLWHCEGARNHGLQSILCRLSLGVYRAIVRPEGLQFSETAVRLPSFIAGALSIPALALLVARLGFPWAGVVAAALLALHPWHLKLATEARGYPFVFLFIPLIALCVARAAPSGNWTWLAAFAALEFALLYAWPGTLLTVLVANAALLALIFRFATSRETASTALSPAGWRRTHSWDSRSFRWLLRGFPSSSIDGDHTAFSAACRVVQEHGRAAALLEVFGRRQDFSIRPTWNFCRGRSRHPFEIWTAS